jgi:hypothetical protein
LPPPQQQLPPSASPRRPAPSPRASSLIPGVRVSIEIADGSVEAEVCVVGCQEMGCGTSENWGSCPQMLQNQFCLDFVAITLAKNQSKNLCPKKKVLLLMIFQKNILGEIFSYKHALDLE